MKLRFLDLPTRALPLAIATMLAMIWLLFSMPADAQAVPGNSNIATQAITRPANTTAYTANTAWANATSGATYSSFIAACRGPTAQVLIPQIDIWSSANPATKLQGILWLFSTAPTAINDNATFNIAAADFSNLTGNMQGFPFTLTSVQASGAANSGVSLTGTTYHAVCNGSQPTIYGMVQVVNTYTPASNEVLRISLHTVAVN